MFECISIIATVIRIWFSLTDTHKPPHSQRHTHTHRDTIPGRQHAARLLRVAISF